MEGVETTILQFGVRSKYTINPLPLNSLKLYNFNEFKSHHMTIELLTKTALTETLQKQVSDLYKQLNADNKQRLLSEILASDNNVIVTICKLDSKVIGIALLSTYKVISGYRGMVDDVVVDASQRGKGIGRKLMEKLITEGKHLGLNEILLFTGHHRAPAKALYTSLGFNLRKSGIYDLRIS